MPRGTRFLASVGAALRSVVRDRDFAGRNGGEEFAVLLPDTDIAAALDIAERIRATIAEVTLPGTDVPVTVSVGVAGFPDHASTLERLDRLADAALYVAKRQGRNRVELAAVDAGRDLPGPVLPEATVNGSGPALDDAGADGDTHADEDQAAEQLPALPGAHPLPGIRTGAEDPAQAEASSAASAIRS